MAATAVMITQLREMTNEVNSATYSSTRLAEIIERYPLIDERGEAPFGWNTTTSPPTQTANEEWIATYDLNAAAADVWDMKAAAAAADYDYSADGANLHRSQVYQQCQRQAATYRSRRSLNTITQRPEPPPTQTYVAANYVGDDD